MKKRIVNKKKTSDALHLVNGEFETKDSYCFGGITDLFHECSTTPLSFRKKILFVLSHVSGFSSVILGEDVGICNVIVQ